MADIRINALATTAASTASDDFVAVDGSANGTRKLNAYSPTFGGNVTASGNLTVSGASYNDFAGALWLGTTAGYGTLNVGNVSGTGTATYACLTLGDQSTPANATGIYMRGTSAVCGISTAGAPIAFFTGGPGTSEAARFFNNGNFGIGTGSSDGGQKLQVSGSGFISGSLAVGDRAAPAGVSLRVQQAGSDDVGLEWQRTSATNGILLSYNRASSAYTSLSYGASSHTFTISGTTALTLDSSQNATFAGNISVTGIGTFNKSLDNITTESDYAIRIKTSAEDGGLYLGANSTISAIQAIDPGTTFGRNLAIQSQGGNVLIGTTTNDTGRLQVNGTATVVSSGADQRTFLATNSAGSAEFGVFANGKGYIGTTTNDNFEFYSNNTLALTLDSSQRCILAGALRLNNAYTAGAPTATGYVTIQDSAGNTYKVLVGT